MAVVVIAAVMVSTAAWILGGRTSTHLSSVASLVPAAGAESESEPYSSSSEAAHAEEAPGDVVLTRGLLPSGSAGRSSAGSSGTGDHQGGQVHQIPVDDLGQLVPLGWTVGHLGDYGFGAGFVPRQAETGSADGVRTVQLRLSQGEDFITVAETRPDATGEGTQASLDELPPLPDRSGPSLEGDVDHHQVQLRTGGTGDLYVSQRHGRWLAALESTDAQYRIASNLPEPAAEQVVDWVIASDRSRVQVLPGSPSGVERLERGLEELVKWMN